VAHKIICAEEMKQVGGMTAGVRGINCLSTFDVAVPSSIHATFLATTGLAGGVFNRGSTCLLPLSFASFRPGGPALTDIAESRGTNAGQPFGPEEQV
jgi:hypothetical protein